MGEEEKYKEELCLRKLFEGHEGHPCTDRAQEVVPPQVGRQVASVLCLYGFARAERWREEPDGCQLPLLLCLLQEKIKH